MTLLHGKRGKGLVTLLACVTLVSMFHAYLKIPFYEITKGDFLTYTRYQASRNQSVTDIQLIHGQTDVRKDTSYKVRIAPETKLLQLCDKINTTKSQQVTSPVYSKMTLLKVDSSGTVFVSIQTYNLRNRPSSRGNDVIVVWAVDNHGSGSVYGDVIDHKNGTYTGIIKLFWSGPTTIRAKLAASLINTCLKMKAVTKYGNAVFAMQQGWGIHGSFRKNGKKEITPCGANPTIFGFIEVCNLTTINGNMPWYCGKPKKKDLSCSDVYAFATGKFDTKWAKEIERIQNPGHGIFRSKVDINGTVSTNVHISTVPCKDSPANISWVDTIPSGYWLNNTWHMTGCKSEVKPRFEDYRTCLKGKTIIIIGDSTLRQYGDFILNHVMGIKNIKFKQAQVGTKGAYHNFNDMYFEHNITLRYLKHEMAYHNPGLPSKKIISTPQLLDQFAKDNISDLVVVVNYNSHFSAYPPFVLRHRQRELKHALKRLKNANPSAKLFVKKPHLIIDDTRWFDVGIELLDTEILREEFSDVRDDVVLLDAWAISVSHGSQLLHPIGTALESQLQQLLSYLC